MRRTLQCPGLRLICQVALLFTQPNLLYPGDRDTDASIPSTSRKLSVEGEKFELPEALSAHQWAAEPLVENPIALSFDRQGRLDVVETTQGVPCVRRDCSDSHGRPSAERRHRQIEDTDGDGIADASHLVAGQITQGGEISTASAAGLADPVWSTDVSLLWPTVSEFESGPGKMLADLGTRYGFREEDLHGLVFGQDGLLYFSLGDRKTRVVGDDGEAAQLPETGAIVRCAPDGNRFEVIASGLRNPQELAFDDYGNLFVGDSGTGTGNQGRLVHVVEGCASGWPIGYLNPPLEEGGVEMTDDLQKSRSEDQPAYALPSVCNIAGEPLGLAYYPGTGQPNDFIGGFLLCHFGGSISESGIQMIELTPKGAGFEVSEHRNLLRGALATDVTFGPDGRIYFADRVACFTESPRGRIFTLDQAESKRSRLIQSKETGKLLAEGMKDRRSEDFARLLGYQDRRVRMAAQFELASRGESSFPMLRAIAIDKSAPRLARLHALWAMAQLADQIPGAMNDLHSLLQDPDSEVRAQAAKLTGDTFRIEYYRMLVNALRDPEPRVAFFAAQSLGKLHRKEAIPELIELLRRNDDRDLVLRHTIVIALARLGPDPALAKTVTDPSRAVRLGGLLTYRRLEDPEIASFLEDFDPYLVREAARAINDLPIEAALPKLAALLETAPLDDRPLVLRAINAHFLLGQPENARALADFAGRSYVPVTFRAEALNQLAAWGNPPDFDQLTGRRLALPSRDPEPARIALGDFIAHLAGQAPEGIQIATIRAVAELEIPGSGHALWDVVYQTAHPVAARVAALQALEKLQDLRLEVAAQTAGHSDRAELRLAALPVLARFNPAVSLPTLKILAKSGTVAEQRLVFSILGGIDDPRADEILSQAVRRLTAEELPVAAQAELLDAVSDRKGPELSALVQQLKDTWVSGEDSLAPFRSALDGGDPSNGQKVFASNRKVSCLQCHEPGQLGRDPGPSLVGIGSRQTKAELLESIVHPNAKLTSGFERESMTLSTGAITSGTTPPSSMPVGMGDILTRRELRDLIAFLYDLKDSPLVNADQSVAP